MKYYDNNSIILILFCQNSTSLSSHIVRIIFTENIKIRFILQTLTLIEYVTGKCEGFASGERYFFN